MRGGRAVSLRLGSTPFVVASFTLAMACSTIASCGGSTQIAPTDAGQDSADATSDGAPESATGDAGLATCPSNLPGPRLVSVQTPTGHGYCIGATEVTNAQYAAFLAANPNGPSGQSAVCTWLQTWKPFVFCAQTYDPVNRPDYPVACVSWCAAQAYCNWAGQRLCGRIGAGPFVDADLADPKRDEWFNACSAGGAHAYPYGDAYRPSACNGNDYVDGGDGGAVAYEQVPSCTGGVAGLVNMSGNIEEWENACVGTAGETDLCQLRGGYFGSSEQELRCDTTRAAARDISTQAVGIRCCY